MYLGVLQGLSGDDYPSQPTRAHHGTTAKSFADVVHLFEQSDLFDGVAEEVDLVGPLTRRRILHR